MTAPTEPNVEASEGGLRFSSPMDWGCECGGQGNCKPCADMLARNRTCACPNPGFRHATELHDWHERAVRQARAEGWDEGYQHLWDCAMDEDGHVSLRDNPYRAAQPEDARGGEGLG